MPWIENVAAADVPQARHHDAGPNSMLISIRDPAAWIPKHKYDFKEVHYFEFLDAEDEDGFPDEAKISREQARELVRLLEHALDKRMNVVVHCTAGICRSGAVVEIGSQLGFTPVEKYRQPNLRVKHYMMDALGWTYDSEAEHARYKDYKTWFEGLDF
jgi:predicted protein tyrosine phosphatase